MTVLRDGRLILEVDMETEKTTSASDSESV